MKSKGAGETCGVGPQRKECLGVCGEPKIEDYDIVVRSGCFRSVVKMVRACR